MLDSKAAGVGLEQLTKEGWLDSLVQHVLWISFLSAFSRLLGFPSFLSPTFLGMQKSGPITATARDAALAYAVMGQEVSTGRASLEHVEASWKGP